MIIVEHLTKCYGDFIAVRDLSWQRGQRCISSEVEDETFALNKIKRWKITATKINHIHRIK